jgi:acyl-CoA reductase-like NAD-dependent aldehyde dehydrogenase
MSTKTVQGAPQFPQVVDEIRITPQAEIDQALQALQEHKQAWVALSTKERVALLDQVQRDFARVVPRWVMAGIQAKGIDTNSPRVGEEWAAGAWPLARNIRLLREALLDIEKSGTPRIPGPVRTLASGQVAAQIFPGDSYDQIFFTGIQAEIWMEPGVKAEELAQTQASIYRDKTHAGKVTLVLGAGNVASIGPTDILYKLFVEDTVVLYKANPVNAYLGPLLEEVLQALIKPGYLCQVYGGAAEGAYCCNHPGVDEIHITGSDKTFDAIVFGSGPEGAARKAQNDPLIKKPVTGELGNVSPLIVVPGQWSESDLAYQAEHIVSSLVNNAGFNCNATRVIITQRSWPQREALLNKIREILARVPLRRAYYPGATKRFESFVAEHPEAEQFGKPEPEELPWTLISNLDPQQSEDICFTTEAFCGLYAETALDTADKASWLAEAVQFCNQQLWGTLNATIIVHPLTRKEPGMQAALDQAIADLRYGTVGINYWAAAGFTMGSPTWGAFPGHALNDIQSGNGVVHNTLMFERAQKTVLYAPFRSMLIPPWFALRGKAARSLFPRLTAFEAHHSPWKVPGIALSAMKVFFP